MNAKKFKRTEKIKSVIAITILVIFCITAIFVLVTGFDIPPKEQTRDITVYTANGKKWLNTKVLQILLLTVVVVTLISFAMVRNMNILTALLKLKKTHNNQRRPSANHIYYDQRIVGENYGKKVPLFKEE